MDLTENHFFLQFYHKFFGEGWRVRSVRNMSCNFDLEREKLKIPKLLYQISFGIREIKNYKYEYMGQYGV